MAAAQEMDLFFEQTRATHTPRCGNRLMQEVQRLEDELQRKDALIAKCTSQIKDWEEQMKIFTVDADHTLAAYQHFETQAPGMDREEAPEPMDTSNTNVV